MFERFTDGAKRAIVLAQDSARELNHDHVGTEHLLLGVLKDATSGADPATSIVWTYLDLAGVDVAEMTKHIVDTVGRNSDPVQLGHIPFSAGGKKVLELSLREALTAEHNYIGTEHMLLGLLGEGEGVAAQLLHDRGVTVELARDALIR